MHYGNLYYHPITLTLNLNEIDWWEDPPPLEPFQGYLFPLASFTGTALIFCAPWLPIHPIVVFDQTNVDFTNSSTGMEQEWYYANEWKHCPYKGSKIIGLCVIYVAHQGLTYMKQNARGRPLVCWLVLLCKQTGSLMQAAFLCGLALMFCW